jgi:uncharacterized protein (DUF58 family)
MLSKTEDVAKIDHVINVALMLAYAACANDDRVAMMVFDDEIRVNIPFHKGRSHVYGMLDALHNVSGRMVESDYAKAVTKLAFANRKHSLVVVFTDLIDPDSSFEFLNAVSILDKMHRVVCATVSDPNIAECAASNPETIDGVYAKAVSLQAFDERRQAIAILKSRGISVVDSAPKDLSTDLINQYMTLKARSAF